MSGRDSGDPWGPAYYEVAALARKRARVERVAEDLKRDRVRSVAKSLEESR